MLLGSGVGAVVRSIASKIISFTPSPQAKSPEEFMTTLSSVLPVAIGLEGSVSLSVMSGPVQMPDPNVDLSKL